MERRDNGHQLDVIHKDLHDDGRLSLTILLRFHRYPYHQRAFDGPYHDENCNRRKEDRNRIICPVILARHAVDILRLRVSRSAFRTQMPLILWVAPPRSAELFIYLLTLGTVRADVIGIRDVP